MLWYRFVLVLALGAALGGCAATMPDVQPIRPSEIRADNPPQLPILLQFDKGDRIALDVGIDSALAGLEGADGELTLVVQRRFYVLMRGDEPPVISLDGKTLGQVRGNLQIGFGVTKAGTVAQVRLGTSGESP